MEVLSCPYQPACPGCPHFSETGLSAAARGRLQELASVWGATAAPEVGCSGFGSRFRVRLSVRGRKGDLRIGIFEQGSHNLVHIPGCKVHHPSIEKLLPRLKELFDASGVLPYEEVGHTGLVRAVQMAVEPATGRIQMVLLVRDDLSRGSDCMREFPGLLPQLAEIEGVQGLFLGALPHKSNALQAERFVHVAGLETVEDESGGARVFYPPGAFGQANPMLHARVVDEIHSWVPSGARVVEYYAGVGTIGLGLARSGHRVVANEIGAGSLEGLRLGRSALGLTEAELPILVGRAGEHAGAYSAGDTVIVDPPRKGLDRELLERFLREPPGRLVYLSCGIDALLQESRRLSEAGRFVARFLAGYSYFPHTDHVETLLILERKSS